MKGVLVGLAFYGLVCVAQSAAVEHGGLVDAESGEVSPDVAHVVNNFRTLLDGSRIIVVNAGGDERRELAKIESFLARHQGFTDAPEILQAVKAQFRTSRVGFSFPIWLSDDSAKGNACVLGVRPKEALSFKSLVSAKIAQPLIAGSRVRPIDNEVIRASVIAHEMFHCYEYLKGSSHDFWSKAMKMRGAYATHRSESAADAYAALYVLQNFDAKPSLRTLMEFRKLGMLNSDVEHNTSQTVEFLLKTFDWEQLVKLSSDELVRMAAAISEDKAMSETSFLAMKKSAIDVTSAYQGLLAEYPELDVKQWQKQLRIETAMSMLVDAPQDPRLEAQILIEIAASLYKIGAGTAVSSRHFQSLLERYFVHASSLGISH